MSRKSPASGGSPAIAGSPARNKAISTKRFAAVAGGKAAECFVVACCCPCSLVNILFLTVVKIPAGLFRKLRRRRRRRRMRRVKRAGPASPAAEEMGAVRWPEKSPAAEVEAMEEKMWPEFYGTGFWRSPSQRELVMSSN